MVLDRQRYCAEMPTARSDTGDPSGEPPHPAVDVREATEASTELLADLRRLLPQLSTSAPPISAAELSAIVGSPATVLLVARLEGTVVGCLTLAQFRVPTGMRAWIEDVVVDEAARGSGVGAALTLAAVERARTAGARTVDLTSRPSRRAANRLYQRLGFVARETNVYRLDLPA